MSLDALKDYDRVVSSAKSKSRIESQIETQKEEGKIGDNLVKINKKFKVGNFKKYLEDELPTTSQLSKSRKGKWYFCN